VGRENSEVAELGRGSYFSNGIDIRTRWQELCDDRLRINLKKTKESSASLSFHLSRLTIRCLEETIKLFAKKYRVSGRYLYDVISSS